MKNSFKDSQEAAYRRLMRGWVRRAPFTKAERDVTLAILNVWFHHRNGAKKYIHPSRYALANKAGVSVKTVSRALETLRSGGALVVMSDTKGGRSTATRYRVDDLCLLAMCGVDIAEMNAAMSGVKRDICPGKNGKKSGTKCPTVKINVAPVFEPQNFENHNVVPLRFGGVAK